MVGKELNKTFETLDQVKHSGDMLAPNSVLPDPELYIIVNGKPTKTKVVWRTLVDVNHVKAAIRKLKESNWLYKEVNDDSVDDAAKKVIEVTVLAAQCLRRPRMMTLLAFKLLV